MVTDLRDDKIKVTTPNSSFIVILIVVTILILLAGLYGFASVSSPSQIDNKRQTDIAFIQETIMRYALRNNKLPSSLEEIVDLGSYGSTPLRITDPETNTPYGYKVTDFAHYQLCATFKTDSTKDAMGRSVQEEKVGDIIYGVHSAGYKCFPFSVEIKPTPTLGQTIYPTPDLNTGITASTSSILLPENLKVYIGDNTVINHPFPGFEERILPTYNYYTGQDGGYVAVYTREKEGSVYGVGGDTYVIGQVRVRGKYIGRIFYPEGYSEGDNITQDTKILEICNNYFPAFKGKMWIGGDTGGWYGIQ